MCVVRYVYEVELHARRMENHKKYKCIRVGVLVGLAIVHLNVTYAGVKYEINNNRTL